MEGHAEATDVGNGLFVAIPYTRPFYGATVDSLIFMKHPDAPLWFKRLPNMAIDVARNYLVLNFLQQHGARYLLFIDNDCVFDPESALRLMERDLPMVCGTMYTRALPPTPTIGDYVGRTKDGKDIYRFNDTTRQIIEYCKRNNVAEDTLNAVVFPKREGDLIEKHGCGMHFTMIRRDVFEAIGKLSWFKMGGKTGAGEDFYFCKMVREAGFKIYWDISVHTGHLAGEDADFGLREMLSYFKHVDDFVDDSAKWEVEVPG